ncbi:nuclease EXOG, mitochondrial-like [Tubulanus polymorphus]|uniref:nuclease EXOG, mitochondrial-like n=1 Tax=Tubulanus polymorphus TaxID=672921 RepID=UPI003DA4BAB2
MAAAAGIRGFIIGTISTATIAATFFPTATTNPEVHFEYEESTKKARPTEKVARGEQILKLGVPDLGQNVRYYSNHALGYDQSRRIPLWVAEHLTADNLKGRAHRKHSNFKSDPNIDEMFTARNSDYRRSGWSRGHMAPAGDNKKDQVSMDETFYLSNIVPQNMDNNAGFWNRLEMYCRDLTKNFTDVYVISGPLFLPELDEKTGKKYVRYEVIGDDNVAVPTHLYKLIIVDGDSGRRGLGAFVVPNKPVNSNNLTEFQTSLEALERTSGIKFLDKLPLPSPSPAGYREDLCTIDKCLLVDQDEHDLKWIRVDLKKARNRNDLERAWSRLRRKGLKADETMQNLYNEKLNEFDMKSDSGEL